MAGVSLALQRDSCCEQRAPDAGPETGRTFAYYGTLAPLPSVFERFTKLGADGVNPEERRKAAGL